MKIKRRELLKLSALAGLSFAGSGALSEFVPEKNNSAGNLEDRNPDRGKSHTQHFNMSGYAAPKLDTVRAGFIGLGNRGPAHLDQVSKIEGVDIMALCDLRPEKVNAAAKIIENTAFKPQIYTGNQDEWKKVCERKDIDL